MSEYSPERRQSAYDLELGKQHMLEMYERILPLIKMDEVSNNTARALMEDIKNAESALVLKDKLDDVRKLIEKFGTDIRVRREDRELIRSSLEQMEREFNEK